jgi:hypothetical protein
MLQTKAYLTIIIYACRTFIVQATGVNVIKHFSSSLMKRTDKLERLSQLSISSLV